MNEMCSFSDHQSHMEEVLDREFKGPRTVTISTREARNDHEARITLFMPDADFADVFTRLRPRAQVWLALTLASVGDRSSSEEDPVLYTIPWKKRFPWSRKGTRTLSLSTREVPDDTGMRVYRHLEVVIG